MRSIIISPDADLARQLERTLSGISAVKTCQTLHLYPSLAYLPGCLRSQEIDVVFLSFTSVDQAVEIARFLECEVDGVQTVAFGADCESASLRESMRAGVREFLVAPFEESHVLECLRNTRALLDRNPPKYAATDQLFAFLPSKPGVGTSTLALNVAAALASKVTGRTLLCDFDLSCGMIQFMLKLANQHSVVEAVQHALNLDERMWADLVTPVGALDVQHAGNMSSPFPAEPELLSKFVGFVRRLYGAACFDLSGNLDFHSLEIMKEAKRIYLVCTPEIPSLHLARQKLAFLGRLDLSARVEILLNRNKPKAAFNKENVQQVLGMPVRWAFTNDYVGVAKAIAEGRAVDSSSELGQQVQSFADSIPAKPKVLEPRSGWTA